MIRRLTASFAPMHFGRREANFAGVVAVLALMIAGVAPQAFAQSQSGFTYNGIVYTSYQASEYQETPQGAQSTAALKATGANYASVVVTQYVQTSTSNTIAPETTSTPGYNSSADPLTPTDAAVAAAIQNLQAQGLTVFLKPHVDSIDGVFRGSFAPTNVAAWFASYQTFILHYAQIASENNVGGLVIGTELKSLTGSAYASYWDNIIALIRATYPSLTLAYGANATSAGDEFTTVSFWDKVDIIGVDGYFPLTNHADPTVAQLVAAWTDNKSNFNIVSALKTLQSNYNKPLIFTELGYVSASGTNEAPFTAVGPPATYDPTEQENCYEAFFEVFSQETSWMKGVFWWDWNVSPPGSDDTGYSPQNKPAATVTLPKWFGSTTAGFTLAAYNSTLTLGEGLNATDTVAVTDLGGFTGAVSLAATGLPTGVSAAFTAGSVAGTQVMTLTASNGATTGVATVTITGMSGSVAASTTVALTVQAPNMQSITFADPGPQTVGIPLTLSATATSGLAVTFASSTTSVCTVNNTTASFLLSGNCTIVASQAGNSLYAAATPVSQTFGVSTLPAVPVPAAADVIVSQVNWLHALTGFVQTSNNPTGGSFAVNANGSIVVADTSSLFLINSQTGVTTTLGAWSGASAVAIDTKNNIYVGNLYGTPEAVVKLPYIGGTSNGGYAAFTTPTTSTPACTSNSATECIVSHVGAIYPSAMAFDTAGDLFWITASDGATGGNGIFECTVACLGGTGSPVQIYGEPKAATTPSTSSGQLVAGGLAIDSSGNVFFTDSSTYVNVATFAYTSFYSNLNELPTSKGVGFGGATTGYAGSPSILYTLTPSSIGAYNNQIDGVAVNATNGTVYFADQSDGVFAFPNSGSPIAMANGQPTALYAVATQGAKTLALDARGNVYLAASSTAINTDGADTLAEVKLNSLTVPTSPVGTAASTPAYSSSAGITTGQVFAVVNDGVSAPAVSVTASQYGKSTSEFSATTGAGSALKVGMAFPVTVTFTPTNVGERSAVLTATDTASGGGSGSATATGVGQGAVMTLDPGIQTTYTSSLFVQASFVSADSMGNVFVSDENSGAGEVLEIAAGSTTPVLLATGFAGPTTTTSDANGNLYVSDSLNNQIVEIPNVNGVLVPASKFVVVASTVTFGGTKLNAPYGLAVGPDNVLYISDYSLNSVFTYNLNNGSTGVRVSGQNGVAGIAVDAASTLYVAINGSGSPAMVYPIGGGSITLAVPKVSAVDGIAVDPSGSVFILDQTTGEIVRIPNENGTLTAADAVVVETNPESVTSLALDGAGNLYTINPNLNHGTIYKFNRTAAALSFATSVADGSSSSPVTLYVENAGNVALSALATSTPTGPFTLAAGTPPCTATLATGSVCDDSFVFAPTGTESGSQSGAATVSSNAPSASVTLNGTAAALNGQTISFNNPGTQIVGTPLTLTATATSGLAVAFTSATTSVCTVSNTTATFLMAGTCTINANQAGSTSFAAAPQVQQSFTVNVAPSFTLAPTASTLSVTQGSSANDSITLTGANGFTGSVTLTVSGLPSGVTASFGTNPTTGTSGVTLTAGNTATTGVAMVTITGTSGSLTASTTIALTVTVAPSFTLAPTASTLSVTQGTSASDTVTVSGANGFTGSVTLAATGLPSGVTASFATNPTTGSSGVTFTTSSTATAGAATVTITGTSGSLTASTTIALTVSLPPSFTLAPTAPTLSVTQGNSASDTVTVTGAHGFTGSVTLAATGLPSGVTASFGTNPTTGTSGVTFTASSTATTGAATVTITGTSGSLTASTTIALTVSLPSSFTLAPTASTVSITQSGSASDTITVTGANGFNGSVTLSASGLPGGVTAAFATNPTTGSSALTLTATSTAAIGVATVTITGTSGSLTASTTIALTVNVAPSIGLAPTASTVPVTQGSSATDTITVTGAGGFAGSVSLTATVTSSPSGAQDIPTVTFGSTSPVNVTSAGGGTATLTISTTPATTGALTYPAHGAASMEMAGGTALACLLLLGIPAKRRKWPIMLGMLALLFALTSGMVGCGGSSTPTPTGNSGTTRGSYVVTVTATAGTTTTTLPVTITVQ